MSPRAPTLSSVALATLLGAACSDGDDTRPGPTSNEPRLVIERRADALVLGSVALQSGGASLGPKRTFRGPTANDDRVPGGPALVPAPAFEDPDAPVVVTFEREDGSTGWAPWSRDAAQLAPVASVDAPPLATSTFAERGAHVGADATVILNLDSGATQAVSLDARDAENIELHWGDEALAVALDQRLVVIDFAAASPVAETRLDGVDFTVAGFVPKTAEPVVLVAGAFERASADDRARLTPTNLRSPQLLAVSDDRLYFAHTDGDRRVFAWTSLDGSTADAPIEVATTGWDRDLSPDADLDPEAGTGFLFDPASGDVLRWDLATDDVETVATTSLGPESRAAVLRDADVVLGRSVAGWWRLELEDVAAGESALDAARGNIALVAPDESVVVIDDGARLRAVPVAGGLATSLGTSGASTLVAGSGGGVLVRAVQLRGLASVDPSGDFRPLTTMEEGAITEPAWVLGGRWLFHRRRLVDGTAVGRIADAFAADGAHVVELGEGVRLVASVEGTFVGASPDGLAAWTGDGPNRRFQTALEPPPDPNRYDRIVYGTSDGDRKGWRLFIEPDDTVYAQEIGEGAAAASERGVYVLTGGELRYASGAAPARTLSLDALDGPCFGITPIPGRDAAVVSDSQVCVAVTQTEDLRVADFEANEVGPLREDTLVPVDLQEPTEALRPTVGPDGAFLLAQLASGTIVRIDLGGAADRPLDAARVHFGPRTTLSPDGVRMLQCGNTEGLSLVDVAATDAPLDPVAISLDRAPNCRFVTMYGWLNGAPLLDVALDRRRDERIAVVGSARVPLAGEDEGPWPTPWGTGVVFDASERGLFEVETDGTARRLTSPTDATERQLRIPGPPPDESDAPPGA